jgi:hypothetical protein
MFKCIVVVAASCSVWWWSSIIHPVMSTLSQHSNDQEGEVNKSTDVPPCLNSGP